MMFLPKVEIDVYTVTGFIKENASFRDISIPFSICAMQKDNSLKKRAAAWDWLRNEVVIISDGQ